MQKPTVLVSVLFLCAVVSLAQETRGSILGRVIDSSGAVIPGVAVRATNTATNVTVSAQSNAEGNYNIPYLLPGVYTLKAELAGFKTFVRENIQVRIDDRIAIDIPMEVGQVSERVTVTAETPLLESATASMGQVIDQRRIADLPIAHGNPFLLMQLSAGVVYTQNPGLDRPFELTHIVGYSMDGVRANRNEITMDGVPDSAVKRGTTDVIAGGTPPSDIVQEFKVQTMTFDAAVGHTQGGVTSITLKSGGNELHGTAYYGLLNPALNANLFFANKAGQPRGDFTYNRWGGTATGPVFFPKLYHGKDHTFFTYAYEGIHESRAMGAAYGSGTMTVPTAAEREGDFSALLKLGAQYQIYDPFTRKPAAGGRFQEQPVAGNIIPPSRISPIARKILEYWALPNAPGTADGINNLIRVNDPEVITYRNHIARVDHAFSERHRMFGRVNTFRRFSYSSDWFRSPATGGDSLWPQKALSLDDVFHFGPATFLNVRYGFYNLGIAQGPLTGRGFDITTLGFPKSYADRIDPSVRAFPAISISGYAGSTDNWFRDTMGNMSLEAHLTHIRGNHALRWGGDGRHYRTNHYVWNSSSTGAFSFDTTYTRGPMDNSTSAPIGQGLASLLFGIATGGGVDRFASFAEQSTVWSLYVQDDWRITSKLTLNLGLRYEIEGPMTERFNRAVRGYDFQTPSPMDAQVRAIYAKNPISEVPADKFRLSGGLTFPGVSGQPRTLWARDANNFMPRAGFAYQLNQKTVIRSGFGIYYAGLGIQRGDVTQTGFSQRTSLIPTLDNGLTFVATLANPFPDPIQEPRGAADGLMTYVGRSISFYNPNPQAASQKRWQFSIQRELPQRVLLDVGYVGNHGDDLETSRDYRPLPLQYLSRLPYRDTATINYLSEQVPNPFAGLLPGTSLSGANVSRSYLLSSGAYPHFTGLTSTSFEGYSWFHSLQVKMERRFAAGWSLNATYMWSKNMEATGRLNGYVSPLEYVVSDQDRPHRFVISGIWELPFGRGKKLLGSAPAVLEKIAGGWQLQGIYTKQSGAALGFGNALFIGDIHDITLPSSQRRPERWFNTEAGFDKSSARQLSNNYRLMPTRFNDVRANGINSFDLSALKNTNIGERFRLQFRGEFLNAFNHVFFGSPNTSPTSTAFGQVTSQTGYPRRIQLGFKLLF
jgi:hypothetical protein